MATKIWSLVREFVPARKRKRIAKELVDIFEQQDCDTMYEAEQLMKDAGIEYDD